jgi:preprotein translocase subunit SecD
MARLRLALTLAAFLVAAPAWGQQATGLELLILANEVDDATVGKDVRELFDNPPDSLARALAKCQVDGLPPPVPQMDGKPVQYIIEQGDAAVRAEQRKRAKEQIDDAARKLREAVDDKAEQEALKELDDAVQRLKKVPAAKSLKSTVTYRWVQLGPEAQRLLGLDNAAGKDPKRDAAWKRAKEMRGKATQLPWPDGTDRGPNRHLLQGALFYSRECRNAKLTAVERDRIQVEYFVLVREPEFDPGDPTGQKRAAVVSGKHITKATVDRGPDKQPHLAVQLNAEGGQLLAELTGKNASIIPKDGSDQQPLRRHLGVVVDGKLVSAPPAIMTRVTAGAFWITGDFSVDDLEALAEQLRPKQ